jgi:predicted AAA+ superfamily ATPase
MERKLKPWREVAVPHEDVLRGTFQQAEFAADLSAVHQGTAPPQYQDPALFFQRTFITEGMRLLLDSVLKRLSGRGGDPVIQLQTAFGGGKTHTMLAVYHLARGTVPAEELRGMVPLLQAAGLSEAPRARLVVLDGNRQAPNIPQNRGGTRVHTLWGELAWQLGGGEGYELVRQADESGTSPGKEVLAGLLAAHSPCVILIDELVAYIRQFEEGKILSGGTFDSNLSFVQALTEALKVVPTALLLASLPESEKEAGSRRGQMALQALSHYFGRVQALWKPVASEEAFEIVRRRLFRPISDEGATRQVCRAFADTYLLWPDDLPRATQESRYFDRLLAAYPIHPELFDRLYEDWSSLENFQRTRGVLKLMARIIHRLWQDGNNDLMIMPGSLPLYDGDTRNELIYYLPQGWDPVLERDIDGERSATAALENKEPRLGAMQACRRVARTIFLGSAPVTTGQVSRGVEVSRILLGSLQPGQQPGLFRDALDRLQERLHHLNSGNDRFWFDTRPNLRREMEERKRRFQDGQHIRPALKDRLQKLVSCSLFDAVHVFVPGQDIADDTCLRLVVLPPEGAWAKTMPKPAQEAAGIILTRRGEQPRSRQNRLVFLAADFSTVGRLTEQVRTLLAWESIVKDAGEEKILLDQAQIRQVKKEAQDAEAALKRMIAEAWRWILAPVQLEDSKKGLTEVRWEAFQLNSGAPDLGREIARVLKDNELVIDQWAPIHLANLLKRWFWKAETPHVGALDVWQKTCCYLYLPRLANEGVFRAAVEAGATSRDFFGLAYGLEEGRYLGLRLGQSGPVAFDSSLLLLDPGVAHDLEEKARAEEAARQAAREGPQGGLMPLATDRVRDSEPVVVPAPGFLPPEPPRFFHGTVEVNPYQAKAQLMDLVDEVLLLFTGKPGVEVCLRLDLEASSTVGFDENLRRAVRDNCGHLGFKTAEFEEGG